MIKKIATKEKLEKVKGYWNPGIIAELNGQHVKLARLKGAFDWHHHEEEDELFYVISGQLEMQFRDHSEFLKPGELIVVPKGVEHRPVAEKEVQVMLFEPSTTLNTGNVKTDKTIENPDWI